MMSLMENQTWTSLGVCGYLCTHRENVFLNTIVFLGLESSSSLEINDSYQNYSSSKSQKTTNSKCYGF